ncbi:MAG: DUF3732 domain-containing protein [Verrucomicrobiales bacterium]|nr:DUF3732 domain-containing protein [Verrucomicrobiales bacterium]
MKNGEIRKLDFAPGKINVITGGSNTGKSALLHIIDYCLFTSSAEISESVINENVSWYGIVIHINGKDYTICRGALVSRHVSKDYYFSSVGLIPDVPEVTIDESSLKLTLEAEFGIDSSIRVPYGGRFLQADSKFSFRYFLMFNTISQDTITNSSVFFDKQDQGRYREALDRIFDLAIGVSTIENIIAKERKAELTRRLKALERKKDRLEGKKATFEQELNSVIRQAKEYGLIPETGNFDSSLEDLRQAISEFSDSLVENPTTEVAELQQQVQKSKLAVRNLQRLNLGYKRYKATLKNNADSLKPLEYIEDKRAELVKTSIFADLIEALTKDLVEIKGDIKNRTAIERNIEELIEDERRNIERNEGMLAISAQQLRVFNSEREKHFFMGKVASQLDLYVEPTEKSDTGIGAEIHSINEALDQLTVKDVEEQRVIAIRLLEEFIGAYITLIGDVLENYSNYLPQFDLKTKTLSLRKPRTDYVDSIGSSSNHLFLHLFLFLGLHDLIKSKQVPFVPPFLIIDQPSRPYWGGKENDTEEGALKTGDEEKIRMVFKLLDSFTEGIKKTYNEEFQIIVLEHVPEDYWQGLKHVHCVEEFVGGNALVRPGDMQKW